MRTAIIRDSIVENVIELEAGGDWTPPAGTTLVPSKVAGPGDLYDGAKFTSAPSPPTAPDASAMLADRMEALSSAIMELSTALAGTPAAKVAADKMGVQTAAMTSILRG